LLLVVLVLPLLCNEPFLVGVVGGIGSITVVDNNADDDDDDDEEEGNEDETDAVVALDTDDDDDRSDLFELW
jgi:hypothetical protein